MAVKLWLPNSNPTGYSHHYGDIFVLKNMLSAIGGNGGRKVEVYNGIGWNEKVIPSIGKPESNTSLMLRLLIGRSALS